jgi:basic membrane protein A
MSGRLATAGTPTPHDQGRQYMERELGDKIKTIYRESVPESQDVEKAMKDMIAQGAKAIFATSFGYMDMWTRWPRSIRM